MPTHTETVMIIAGGIERAVRVTVEAPELGALDLQALAQEALIRPGRTLRRGDLVVKVEFFKRR